MSQPCWHGGVARGYEHDDADRELRQILLVLEVPVGSKEDAELLAGHLQEFSIPDPLPPSLRNGHDVEALE